MERIRLDMCALGRTEVILGMPWLVAHNPEIDWEKGEVKMMRCPPMCGKRESNKEKWKRIRLRRARKVEDQKAISWMTDKKEDWGREEEMEMDHQCHKLHLDVSP